MSSTPRSSVLSLRLSDEEQRTLRAAAEARGTSVSDLVRSLVSRELASPALQSVTTSNATSVRPSIGQGIFWQVADAAAERGSPSGFIVTTPCTR